MKSTNIAIIGGGPAGMSAAIAAADAGLDCMLVDEAPNLGGQIWRRPNPKRVEDAPRTEGDRLREQVSARGDRIQVLTSASVWALFPGFDVMLSAGAKTDCVRADQVIVATGAYEYVPPFPGWTLPGVMTPGAAQILAKTMKVRPGKKIVVAGTGPFLLAVALQLIDSGFAVETVLEAASRQAWWKVPVSGWRTPGIVAQGIGMVRRLRRAGVKIDYGRIVTHAHGENTLQAVTHAPVDAEWRPQSTDAIRMDADTLCVGYGFVPRIHLLQTVGCELEYRDQIGGWVPARDHCGMSNVEGVSVAGDGAGVAGSLVAMLEGELSGVAAGFRAGAIGESTWRRRTRRIQNKLAKMQGLRRVLDDISRPRTGLNTLVDDETVLCRCEEVTYAELCAAIEHGNHQYRSLKVATRIGMGPCQGRFCWPAACRQVAARTHCTPQEIGPAEPRPPVRPVTLGALARAAETIDG